MSLRLPAAAVALGLDPECRIDAGGGSDAGAAGGAGAPPMDAPAIEPEGQPADTSASAADVVDDDDDSASDDAEIDNSPLKDDPRVRRLRNQLRSAKRRVAASREFVDTARALGLTAAQLRDVDDLARRYKEALPVIQSREFLEVASKLPRGDNRAEPDRRQEPALPAFNEDDFPFDKNDPAGRWMLDRERNHYNEKNELRSMVQALSRDIAQLKNGFTGEQRAKDVATWKGAIDGACSKVPEKLQGLPLRNMLRDALIGARAEAQRRGVRLDPQKAIAHYLKEFGLSSTTQAAAKAAASQRIAETNKTRPGGQAFVGGQPTAAGDRSQERIGDVSRRLLGKRYHGSGRL
jgi:hypothetical protein